MSSGGKLNMHLFDLKGKTALITGASSGLGEQFARSLYAAGARVILAARRIDKLNTLATNLGNAKAIQMDGSDKQSIKSCITVDGGKSFGTSWGS